jgi:hypothetical protein
MVRVQCWVQMKKGSNLDEQHLYEDYWNGKWKYNLANLEQWFKIAIVLFSFPSQKNMTNKSQIIIPNSCSYRMKMNMEVAITSNNL